MLGVAALNAACAVTALGCQPGYFRTLYLAQLAGPFAEHVRDLPGVLHIILPMLGGIFVPLIVYLARASRWFLFVTVNWFFFGWYCAIGAWV